MTHSSDQYQIHTFFNPNCINCCKNQGRDILRLCPYESPQGCVSAVLEVSPKQCNVKISAPNTFRVTNTSGIRTDASVSLNVSHDKAYISSVNTTLMFHMTLCTRCPTRLSIRAPLFRHLTSLYRKGRVRNTGIKTFSLIPGTESSRGYQENGKCLCGCSVKPTD